MPQCQPSFHSKSNPHPQTDDLVHALCRIVSRVGYQLKTWRDLHVGERLIAIEYLGGQLIARVGHGPGPGARAQFKPIAARSRPPNRSYPVPTLTVRNHPTHLRVGCFCNTLVLLHNRGIHQQNWVGCLRAYTPRSMSSNCPLFPIPAVDRPETCQTLISFQRTVVAERFFRRNRPSDS